jgi:alanine-synthesizing transaminase
VSSGWSFPRVESLPVYPFLAADVVKAEAIAAGADIIDLGLGNPDQPTPRAIVEQLELAAREGKNHRYHPGTGLLELRRALSRWYERRYAVRFSEQSEVIVTMGAKEGISHLCLAILEPGDTVIAPDPSYPIHRGAPVIAGAEVLTYDACADLEPSVALAAALERAKAEGRRVKLIIANYPQNPTGLTVSREELGRFVRVAEASGAYLLHDLAYADSDFRTRHAPSIFDCGVPADAVKAFAVEVYSMSKSYNMPGWRVAFMVGNPRLIAALAHLKSYMDYGTFAPLQLASAWALEHGDALVEEIRERYRSRAEVLAEGLRAAGWPGVAAPSGTMFLWVPLPRAFRGEGSMVAVTRLIREAQVAVSPGVGFGPAGDAFVRFALIEDPPRLLEACRRLRAVLPKRELDATLPPA